jgi:AcrR family transcriptional regulator
LTRERVLAEVPGLLDRDRFEALTIRHLADHLGVSPMALHNHVSSKQDLLQGIAQHLLTQARFSSDHSNWRECIRVCFRELRRVCLAHPSAVHVMEAIEVAPLAIFRPLRVRKPLGADLAHVERVASLKTWDFDRAFEFGLSVILTGLERVGGK